MTEEEKHIESAQRALQAGDGERFYQEALAACEAEPGDFYAWFVRMQAATYSSRSHGSEEVLACGQRVLALYGGEAMKDGTAGTIYDFYLQAALQELRQAGLAVRFAAGQARLDTALTRLLEARQLALAVPPSALTPALLGRLAAIREAGESVLARYREKMAQPGRDELSAGRDREREAQMRSILSEITAPLSGADPQREEACHD